MVVSPHKAANHRIPKISGIAVKIAAGDRLKMAEPGQPQRNQGVIPGIHAVFPPVQASAVRPVSVSGAVPGAVTSAGFQDMETKRGSLSTRFSQAFIDG